MQPQQKNHNIDEQQDIQQQESQYSSQDEDGVLLTNKVQQKLLSFVAKLKNKDPQIYNVQKPIFQDNDFQAGKEKNKKGKKQNTYTNKNKQGKQKYTYKDLLTKEDKGELNEQSQQNIQQYKQKNLDQIKASFKSKLNKNQKNKQEANQDNQDLFKIKKKIMLPKKTQQQKLKQFVSGFDNKSSQLLTNLWKDQNKLDKTDVFLRNYIINQRWKTSKLKKDQIPLNDQKQEMIDQQDQQRSIQMDEYQAKYNFRFQQPGADKIIQYPRQIPQSMRLVPQTRKQKRKKLAQRKKQEQQQIRKQYEHKKQQKKQQILKKLHQNQVNQHDNQMQQQKSNEQFDHDWFFCDDCAKALQQKQVYHVCYQCDEYMLCEQCHELIIHKHQMQKATIPIGAGPPQSSIAQKALKKLKSCKNCRKKIPHYLKHYQYTDRSSQLLNILCQKCFDESSLDIKKKFKQIQPAQNTINYQQILDKNPQKIKQLTNQKDIQQLVDQYIKYDFEDIIGGGLKTKFKYINVKPEGYGLSDQQILYGDDKQLNKYISIKKLGAYQDQKIKLRNNLYNRKIKFINKSASQNKKLITKIGNNSQALRAVKKIQTRAQILKKRRQARNNRLRIINISNPQDQKKLLVPKSRLESYGLAVQQKQDQIYSRVKKL